MKNIISLFIKKILLLIIKIYQYFISPLLGPKCRFLPTCSEYAKQSIIKHGPFKGLIYSFKRIMKCHPWHPGGIDEIK